LKICPTVTITVVGRGVGALIDLVAIEDSIVVRVCIAAVGGAVTVGVP